MLSSRVKSSRPETVNARSRIRSASPAVDPASSSTREAGARYAKNDAGRLYSEAILDQYLWLPGTPTRISRLDRRLAEALYERGVPLAIARAALLMGVARRTFRDRDALPLPPIRTLHYFLPIVAELLDQPPATGYLEYLENRLFPLAEAKAGFAPAKPAEHRQGSSS